MDDQNYNIFVEYRCNNPMQKVLWKSDKISNIIPHGFWDGLDENEKNDRAKHDVEIFWLMQLDTQVDVRTFQWEISLTFFSFQEWK